MKNESEDFSSRKEFRRKKIKNKKDFHKEDYEDPVERKAHKNSDYKKHKHEIEEEEWENWDRYYNH